MPAESCHSYAEMPIAPRLECYYLPDLSDFFQVDFEFNLVPELLQFSTVGRGDSVRTLSVNTIMPFSVGDC